MAVSLSPLIQPLNMLGLAAHAALQLYALAMVRSNGSLCAAPLLLHPASKARIHGMHSIMRLATLGLPGKAVWGGSGWQLIRFGCSGPPLLFAVARLCSLLSG